MAGAGGQTTMIIPSHERPGPLGGAVRAVNPPHAAAPISHYGGPSMTDMKRGQSSYGPRMADRAARLLTLARRRRGQRTGYCSSGSRKNGFF
jgi:hypothetical protein